MKRRYTIDADSGLLIDRDGNELGRVVAITVETSPRGVGGCSSSPSTTAKSPDGGGLGEPRRPTATQLEAAAIARIWEQWFSLFPSKRKRAIDSTSRTLIKNALHLRGEDATRLALLGLSRSPFHNGQNSERRRYLELRYALKGKPREGETDEDRIDRAISWAAIYAPRQRHIDPAKVERWLDDVRYHIGKLNANSHAGRQRATEAYSKLRDAGFRVVRLDKSPWARLER